jgi:hypothetical protein
VGELASDVHPARPDLEQQVVARGIDPARLIVIEVWVIDRDEDVGLERRPGRREAGVRGHARVAPVDPVRGAHYRMRVRA